jgi:hypothetical protein
MGSFRLPVPTSRTAVVLKTVLAKTVDADLVLYDASANTQYAVGHGNLSADLAIIPYDFTVPSWAPLQLDIDSGIMQDTTARPYKVVPLPALEPGAQSLRRIAVTDGHSSLVVVSSGGTLFTETAEEQPALTGNPSPLFALSSIAGTGLQLPAGFDAMSNWSDAISTYIPPDPSLPVACAAPFLSTMRATPGVSVTVPAGKFQTIAVREIIETCQQVNAPALQVFEIDRWYAQGIGPVQISYQDSNAVTHLFELVSDTIVHGDNSYWPLGQGDSWSYQTFDGTGAAVGAPVQVSVSAVTTVTQP